MNAWLRRVDVLNEERQSTARSHASSVIGTAVQAVSRFMTTLLIGRVTGAATLGHISASISTAQLIYLAWPASVSASVMKFVPQARGRDDAHDIESTCHHLASRLILTAFPLAVLGATSAHFALGLDWLATSLVFLMVLAFSGQAFVNAVQYTAGMFVEAARWDVASAVLALISVVVLLACGVRGLAVAFPICAWPLIQTVMRWPKRGARTTLPRPLIREMDMFNAVTTLGTLSSAGFYHAALVVTATTYGHVAAGHYASVLVFATPLMLAATTLSSVLYPQVAERVARQEWDAVGRLTEASTIGLMSILIWATGPIVLCGPLLYAWVWGPDFQAPTALLPILLASVVVAAVAAPSVNMMTAQSQRNAAAATAWSVAGLAVGVGYWIVTPHSWGPVAIASGYLIGKASFSLLILVMAWHRAQLGRRLVFVKAAVAIALVTSGSAALDHTRSPWPTLLAALAFVAVWGVLALPDLKKVRRDLYGGQRQKASN